jgi:PAS domain S-box-containing protein
MNETESWAGSRLPNDGNASPQERCTLYEAVLGAATEVILCVDLAQRVVYANAAAARAFGYAPEEFERMPLEKLIPESQRMRHAALADAFFLQPGTVPRAMAGGRVVAALRKDGSEFPFEVTLTRLESTAGLQWVAAIGSDVTEREAAAARLARQDAELRNKALALQALREAERGRIARELHENLGQHLAAMSLDTAWIEQYAKADSDGLDQRLAQMRQSIGTVVGALRKLSSELRPLMLDDLGLAATLDWLAQQAWQRHGIKVDVHCAIDASGIDEPVHSSLYRVAEEILHYLGTSRTVRQVALSVEQAPDAVRVGISADAVPPPEHSDAALASVHARTAILGGRIEIEHLDKGMTVRVTLPLPNEGSST